MDISRRGLFGLFAGIGAGLAASPVIAKANESACLSPVVEADGIDLSKPGALTHAALRRDLGRERYESWFRSLEVERFDGAVVAFSVPVKFVRNWITEHYADALLRCAQAEFPNADRVKVEYRLPRPAPRRRSAIASGFGV